MKMYRKKAKKLKILRGVLGDRAATGVIIEICFSTKP